MKIAPSIRGKLRRPQFRLGTLLTLVGIASVPLAVVASREHAYRARIVAAHKLRNSNDMFGIGIGTSERYPGPCSPEHRWPGPGRNELERADVVTSIAANDYGVTPLSDEEVSAILCFPTLRCLKLQLHEISGTQLATIAKLPSLEHLDLCSARISAEGARHLGNLRSLRDLNLAHTHISDAALEGLPHLPNLEDLDLWGTDVTDDGIRHIAGLCSLQCLRLGDTKITGAALAHLSGLTQLTHLALCRCQIDDESLLHLMRLDKLEYLDLQGTRITDAGVDALRQFGSLHSLELHYCDISDAGLAHLGEMKSLRYVGLSHVMFATEEGVAQLEKAKPEIEVNGRPVPTPAPPESEPESEDREPDSKPKRKRQFNFFE